MPTLEEASAFVAREFPTAVGDPVDHGSFWQFAVDAIGCVGVLVDKADGNLQVMGSGLSPETWIRAHALGFRFATMRFVVTEVHDALRALDLLDRLQPRYPGVHHVPARVWERERLGSALRAPPVVFRHQRLWHSFPWLVDEAARGLPFRYRVENDADPRPAVRHVLSCDVPTYWRLAESPGLVALLDRARERGVVDLVLPLQGQWIYTSGFEGSDEERVRLHVRRDAVTRRPVPSSYRWKPARRLEERIAEVEHELEALVAAGEVDLLCTESRALAERLRCPVVGLDRLAERLEFDPASGPT